MTMKTLKIKDVIDTIVKNCFSEEDKQILEFTQNQTQITVKHQFLIHHKHACYEGELQDLELAIMYKIHQNQDLLLRIKDYTQNITKLLDLDEYNKVSFSYKDQLGTETSIGASGNKSETINQQTDNYSGLEKNKNVNLSEDTQALSQTNKVEGVDRVLPKYSITETEPTNTITHSLINQQQPIQVTKPNITESNPDNLDLLGFQNVQKEHSAFESANTNTSITSRGSDSKNNSTFRNSNVNTKGTKTDEVTRTVDFLTNEARLKLWKTELPKLRTKFWNSFSGLFIYDVF